MATVLTSVNADQSRLSGAQVAVTDGSAWVIMGHGWRLSGMQSFSPMPGVGCPVMDLSNVADDKALQVVMSKHVGCQDPWSLIADLVALGAVVVDHSS